MNAATKLPGELWAHPFCRDRRHRHVRHCRGAADPWLSRAGQRSEDIQDHRPAGQPGRAGLRRPAGRERGRGGRRRRLVRDQDGQPRAGRGPPPRSARRAPRRDAGRADAAEVQHRHRRHPWQDHDHHDGRHAAGCGRRRSDRHQWRRHPCLWVERPRWGRRMDGRRGRREPTAPSTACPPTSPSSPISIPNIWNIGAASTRCARASTISPRAFPSMVWPSAAPTTPRFSPWSAS